MISHQIYTKYTSELSQIVVLFYLFL
ncbi:hypothetical protein MTBPR1_10358 [Candidatus Terasakiella magnetica]|uniref:Uncharacterized protein n=1 Tax=Candidatus Terasakiella magnetica TaxID=1867952 RepID=A0A1C3RCW6_9PROT|nr:hypothetical protein MTBPR1_10358 [Candidatus Terasakiella magnetica]